MKNQIKELLFIDDKFVSKRSRKEYFQRQGKLDLYNNIMSTYDGAYSLRESVMMILTDKPKCSCKICGKPCIATINGGNVTMSLYCSNTCKNKDMAFIMKDIIPLRDEKASQKKREETLLAKTGHRFNSQRPDLKHFWKKSKLSKDVLIKLNDKNWILDQYKVKNRSSQEIAKGLDIFYGTVLAFIDNHGIERNNDYQRSFVEISLVEAIQEIYSGAMAFNNKTVIAPRHLDIYFSDKKLAIEVDGLYWHSAGSKAISRESKNKHRDKTDDAAKAGVQLLHFTDKEITEKKNLVLSMVKSRLGISNKLYARKCSVQELTAKQTREFMEKNHISGNAVAKINLALTYEDKNVQVVSFKKPRFSSEADWELIRFATEIDYTVIGGFQKLLSYFRQMHSGSILSYCDKRYGTGKVYELAGFKHIRTTEPGYFWTFGGKCLTRYQTQKSKLKDLLGHKFIDGTEDESMFAAKYRKFWDCGHKVFLLDK
jgi:very-short-patch-repair endonuclease